MSGNVITIDGPAASGKSTVARALAERLGFSYLDTGALYRAVTLAAKRMGVAATSSADVDRMLARVSVSLEESDDALRVMLDGKDVSEDIRAAGIADHVKEFADNPRVREFVNTLARGYAHGKRIVVEGRDQGTIVFPQARWKFFLTASARVRARRRYDEDIVRGSAADIEETARAIEVRDAADRKRSIAPLVAAPDAVTVDTSEMSIDEVVSFLEDRIRQGIAE